MTAAVRSNNVLSTASQPSTTSCGSGTMSGTAKTWQPARILDHSAFLGSKARALAGEQVDLGVGLAAHDVLAEGHRLKLVKEADRLKIALGRDAA